MVECLCICYLGSGILENCLTLPLRNIFVQIVQLIINMLAIFTAVDMYVWGICNETVNGTYCVTISTIALSCVIIATNDAFFVCDCVKLLARDICHCNHAEIFNTIKIHGASGAFEYFVDNVVLINNHASKKCIKW